MATLEQIGEALKRAHAAGDTDAATKLAQAYRAMSQMETPSQSDGINMSITDRFAAMRENAPPPEPQGVGQRLVDSTVATLSGLVNGIPVIGPLAQNTTDMIGGGIAQLAGGDYGDYVRGQQDVRERASQSAPLASIAGNVGGAIGSFGGLGSLAGGAEALGLTSSYGGLRGLVDQSVKALGSTQLLSTVDNMVRGDSPMEATENAMGNSLLSGAVPAASAATRALGRGVKRVAQPLINASNPENAAARALANNIAKDRSVGGGLGSAEEAALSRAGAPVMNIDRFGEGIRRLGRASANSSSEAGAILRDRAQTRFQDQTGRAQTFLTDLMKGATDDLALQDAIREAAKKSNQANYSKAYNSPEARAIWSPEIAELMQSGTFRSAVTAAESRGADRAAIAGFKAVKNPFEFMENGSVGLKVNPDGSRALPSLQFWDQVKRNLDGMIGAAKRQGDNTVVADLTGLKNKLVNSLDNSVPEYKTARGVAASFFGADDAVDAGRKAAVSTRKNPEIERAVKDMTKEEREAFSVGYTSEIIDMLKERGSRQNVINAMFDRPAAMERLKIALGPQRASEFEAYVRGEQIIDMTRVALSGNSTTAQQLMDLGIAGAAGGAAGYFTSGGSLTQAGMTAALFTAGRKGLSALGKKTDEKVMRKIAEMLSSQDQAVIEKALKDASLSKSAMDALKAIQNGLDIAARGAAMSAPLEITIGGGG